MEVKNDYIALNDQDMADLGLAHRIVFRREWQVFSQRVCERLALVTAERRAENLARFGAEEPTDPNQAEVVLPREHRLYSLQCDLTMVMAEAEFQA